MLMLSGIPQFMKIVSNLAVSRYDVLYSKNFLVITFTTEKKDQFYFIGMD